MHKIASVATAFALAGAMALPVATPVSAQSFNVQFGQQDRFVSDRCERNSRLRGCDDWRSNRHRWSKSDYQRWYRWNQPSIGSIGAGIFGFAVGAAIANGFNNDRGYDRGYDRGWESHVARCEARFRSYNANTDTYLGYDGNYHRCTL
jgi:hypothetical protein